MVNVAMLSFWHVHAPGYAKEVQAHPGARITVVWDEDEKRGQEWADKLGVPFEPDLEKAVSRPDVDGVVVDAPTQMHTDVILAALRAKRHVFTEKVVALTVQEVDRIGRAAALAGVHFVVSFPFRGQPRFKYAKQAADEGLVGHVTTVRSRLAHNGASDRWLPPHFFDPKACGGGAMIDLGCHPMYLARWIGGRPRKVTARLTRFDDRYEVDDNSVAVIEFESGALGVVETSFVSTHSPFALEVYGTEGAILVGGPDDGVWVRSRVNQGKIEGWIRPDRLPEADPSPLSQWLTAIAGGQPPKISLQDGRDLTELMEAATRSHREGRPIELPL